MSGQIQHRARFNLTSSQQDIALKKRYRDGEDYEGSDYDEDDLPMGYLENAIRTTAALVKHYLPQIGIFAALIPLVFFVSFVAGWLLRSSAPTSVEMRVHMVYGEREMPYAIGFLPPGLVSDQDYEVQVRITVPQTPSNVALGNFMTYLTISDYKNQTVASAHRPAAVLPPSKHMFPISLILSSKSYIQITLTLLPAFRPPPNEQLSATLQVGRRDAWIPLSPYAKELTIVESSISFTPLLKGTRRVVGTFPNISGILGGLSFFVTSLLIMTVCFWKFSAPFPGGDSSSRSMVASRRMRGSAGGMGGMGVGLHASSMLDNLPERPRRYADRYRESDARHRSAFKVEEEDSEESSQLHSILRPEKDYRPSIRTMTGSVTSEEKHRPSDVHITEELPIPEHPHAHLPKSPFPNRQASSEEEKERLVGMDSSGDELL